MNDRTKQLWLPGITMLFAAAVVGAVLLSLSRYIARIAEPANSLIQQGQLSFTYFLWLYALVFIGAAGAYWSRRVGGGRIRQAFSGIFPLFLFFAVFAELGIAQREAITMPLLSVVFALPPAYVDFSFPGLNTYLLNWAIIPGAALLLGALPFLLRRVKHSHEMNSAVSAH
jgi:hypothetical protein